MKKLTELESPAIVGVIREKEQRAAIAEIKNCFYDGADMLDLHLSCLDDTSPETLKKIVDDSKLPILALHYNVYYDWTPCDASEEERVAILLRAVDAGVAGIDMQGYTFDAASKAEFHGENKYSFTKDSPKEVVTDEAVIARQCALIDAVHAKGAQVLLSCHPNVPMSPEQVVDLALFLEKRQPDIIKIVTVAETEDQLLDSFQAMRLLKREVKTKVTYHAGGPAGSLSRIVNPMLGGHMIFCVDHFNAGSTMVQLDLKTAKSARDSMRKLL